ncbi:hypothetical protein JCM3775_000942 [Rhodotorula graminis]
MLHLVLAVALSLLVLAQVVQAGPAAYGACQSTCSAIAAACYAAAGFTYGTVRKCVGAPAAIIACNRALSSCSSTCAPLLHSPTA